MSGKQGPQGPNPAMRRKTTLKQRKGVYRLLESIRNGATVRKASKG